MLHRKTKEGRLALANAKKVKDKKDMILGTNLSLFSGIGGLDLAAEWAGFHTVVQCENAEYPTKLLNKHWPFVPKFRNIQDITEGNFHEATGLRTVDIVSGGFPCQPYSCAGKRQGTEDDRYLWPEMLRVVRELRPAWVVAENVAGLLSMAQPIGKPKVESSSVSKMPGYHTLETILTRHEELLLANICESLEKEGYAVEIYCFPACAIDAQHRRDRIAIVGYSEHNGLFATEKYDSACLSGGNQQKRQKQTRESSRTSGREYGADVADAQGQRRNYGHDCKGERQDDREIHAFADTGVFSGAKEDASHAHRDDSNTWRPESERRQRQAGAAKGGDDVADADCEGLQRREEAGNFNFSGEITEQYAKRCSHVGNATITGFQDRSIISLGKQRAKSQFERSGWWPAEPCVGRVAHGVPHRVDRLKGLGNAVVPQQFYPLYWAIAEVMRQMRYDDINEENRGNK